MGRNTGHDVEVVVTEDPVTGAPLPKPAIAIAMHLGSSYSEHVDWLNRRYHQDDGLGYDRAALAADARTRHLA